MTIFGRQPAVWIGIIVTVVLGAVSTLTGQGVISDALAGRITDLVNAAGQLLALASPIITGFLIKPAVTPLAAPKVVTGTAVTVVSPDPAVPDKTVHV